MRPTSWVVAKRIGNSMGPETFVTDLCSSVDEEAAMQSKLLRDMSDDELSAAERVVEILKHL